MATINPKKVAQDMQPSAAHVEVLLVSSVQDKEYNDIGGKAGERHAQHGASQHCDGVKKSAYRLEDDPAADDKKRASIDKGNQDFESFIAIGPVRVSGPLSNPEGDPAHPQRDRVRNHVAGIGQECQRVGDQAAGYLNQHEGENDEERPTQAALIGDSGPVAVTVMMGMPMIVGVTMSMLVRGMVVRRSFHGATFFGLISVS